MLSDQSVCYVNQCVFVTGSAQKCPSHWYGFAAPGKCYRFVDTNFLSYDDARGFCQIHGGDILRIDSTRERVFSLLIIHHLSLVTNYTQLMQVEIHTLYSYSTRHIFTFIMLQVNQPMSISCFCTFILLISSFPVYVTMLQ